MLAPTNRTINSEEKLKLLEEPIKVAISQLRLLADDTNIDLDCDTECQLNNLALWLEGVWDEDPSYLKHA